MAEYEEPTETENMDMESENIIAAAPDEAEEYTVIIDIGEAYVKVGFAGEEEPRAVFPTITGREKYKSIMVDVGSSGRPSIYVGDDCMNMRGVLKITYPISRGQIMDWDSYFAILTHIFYNVLRIDSSKANIIYATGPLTPPETKQYIARVFFETYRAKSVYMASAPILALFSAGLTTGIVVESGEGLTWIVPIVNGQVLDYAVQRLPLAGFDVSEYLKNLLMRYGITLSFSAQRELLRDIKEKACFVALDPERAIRESHESVPYTLPDGESINISMEVRVNAPEILFHPEWMGYQCESIAQAIITAVSRIDRSYWRDLLGNIVLSGGNTMFPGIELRLEKELNALLYQLGPLPEAPKPEKKEPEKPKLVNIAPPKKDKDTCPKCGTMVNLKETDTCPNCGYKFIDTTITIPGQPVTKYPDVCPYCKEKLDEESEFCPFCGKKLEKVVVTKEIKVGVEVPPPIDEPEEIEEAPEFKDEELPDDPDKPIKIILPDRREIAIFRGAAILGALPSFKKLFITYDRFQQDPSSIDLDLSGIL